MSDGSHNPAAGQVVGERYRIDGVLGAGGFATVYAATDTQSERKVAVKVLHRSAMLSERDRARFEREIAAVSALRDPHTVTLFAHGTLEDGRPYIVFEHVPGRDLGELLDAGERLPAEIIVHILRQVLSSLREAHEAGIVHRDIKPENIRVFEYGDDAWNVKVLDFGIARVTDPKNEKLTQTGELVGTPKYMSPEQLLGQTPGPASDIYSLGVVATELLLGRSSMHGNSLADQFDRLRTNYLVAPQGVAGALATVLERMTTRDEQRRFQSADAVLRALSQPASGAAPVQRPPSSGSWVRPPPSTQSQPYQHDTPEQPAARWSNAQLAGVAVVAVSVVALLAVFALTSGSDEAGTTAGSPGKRAISSEIVQAPTVEPIASPSRDTGATTVDPALSDGGSEPGVPDAQLSPGCGEHPGWSRMTLSTSSLSAAYNWTVRLPRSYEPEKRHPVVMMYHKDIVGELADIVKASEVQPVADRAGFIVMVMPTPAREPREREFDVEQVQRALQRTAEVVCIDEHRVFAVGRAGGGAFARTLACEIPLAGFATHAAALLGRETCVPSPAVPYIRLAGVDDPFVPIDGGIPCSRRDEPLESADQIEAQWRRNNGCSKTRKEWRARADGRCYWWDCDGAPFASCRIDGGHKWPRSPEFFLDPCPNDENEQPTYPMMETIWAFFEQQAPSQLSAMAVKR